MSDKAKAKGYYCTMKVTSKIFCKGRQFIEDDKGGGGGGGMFVGMKVYGTVYLTWGFCLTVYGIPQSNSGST